MLEKLLMIIVSVVLDKLVDIVAYEVSELQEKALNDKTNKENQELYANAKDRLEKVQYAKKLLNRN